jgi:hypothetical protein
MAAPGGATGSGGLTIPVEVDASRYVATQEQCPTGMEPMEATGATKRVRTDNGVGAAGEGQSQQIQAIWAELREQKDVILTVGALTLETKKEVREEKGYSLMTALVNPELEWVLAGLAEGKEYQEAVKRSKGKDIGPAYLRIMLKTMEKMIQMDIAKPTSPPEGGVAMRAWWDKYCYHTKHHDIAYEVQYFTIKKPTVAKSAKYGDGTYAKLQWKFRSEFHEGLARLLTASGAVVVMGPAPRQYWERQTADKIDNYKAR